MDSQRALASDGAAVRSHAWPAHNDHRHEVDVLVAVLERQDEDAQRERGVGAL